MTYALIVRWKAYQVVVFDCDSTLSTVEGIDELADGAHRGQRQAIASLTDRAMEGLAPLEDIYGERLTILQPTRDAVRNLKNRYKANVVPDAREVIAALTDADSEPWIVSGGLKEPVAEFATWLGIEPSRVKAVEAQFDPFGGNWWEPAQAEACYVDYERGHLCRSDGKADVIKMIPTTGRRLLIGDGASDLAAAHSVDLFVAYAGVVARPAVVERAPVRIESRSLAPLLPLALGYTAVKDMIGTTHDEVARASLNLLDDGAVQFNDNNLASAFAAS